MIDMITYISFSLISRRGKRETSHQTCCTLHQLAPCVCERDVLWRDGLVEHWMISQEREREETIKSHRKVELLYE